MLLLLISPKSLNAFRFSDYFRTQKVQVLDVCNKHYFSYRAVLSPPPPLTCDNYINIIDLSSFTSAIISWYKTSLNHAASVRALFASTSSVTCVS